MAKGTLSRAKEEAQILRFLSSVGRNDPRNHTAFPAAMLWNDRIIITPLYHSFSNVELTPNLALYFTKQFLEVRAFLSPALRLH